MTVRRAALLITTFLLHVFFSAEAKPAKKLEGFYNDTLSFVSAHGIKEIVHPQGKQTSQSLAEFIKISTRLSIPAKLSGFSKNEGSLFHADEARYGNYPCQLSTAKRFMMGPGNSVVPFNGEFINTDSDLVLPGRGDIHFSFARTYSSFNKSDVGLGIGWRHNYDIWISKESNNYVLHLNNRDIHFSLQEDKWISGTAEFYSLTVNQDGAIFIYTPDLERYVFKPSHQPGSKRIGLSEIASRYGQWSQNTVKIHYLDNSERIDYISDPFDNRVDFFYDQTGHLSAVSTPFSYAKFEYDGNLLKKVGYPKRRGISKSNEQTIEYTYYDSFMVQKAFAKMPFSLVVRYDSKNRVSSLGPVAGNDEEKMWRFSYDNGKTIVDAPFPIPKNVFYFNAKHPSLPSKIVRPALSATTTLDYNADGLLVKMVSPNDRVDIFEYDEKNSNRLFQSNKMAERAFPANGMFADFDEKGIEYTYHHEIALPVTKIFYQSENKRRIDIKKETRVYRNGDITLAAITESGETTRYWQNVFGEQVIILNANGTASISFYSDDCVFQNYAFKDGSVNGRGFLCRKITTDDVDYIQDCLHYLSQEPIQLTKKKRPIFLEEKYSYNSIGRRIRQKSPLADDFSVVNLYGDIICSYSLDKGLSATYYTPWGKPERVFHQVIPNPVTKFAGETIYGLSGVFYRESYVYDKFALLHKHFKTDETFEGDKVFRPFVYERYPSGKIRSVTSPEGNTRVDERDYATGLLSSQFIRSGDGKISVLCSDFEYYNDGILKSITDRFGGKNVFLLDGFGEVYAEISPLGVTTQKKTNILGQEQAKWSYKDKIELARTENIYNERNLLEKVLVYRYFQGEREITTAQTYCYDAVGNIIAERSVQKDSWTYNLFDGLNRKIASLAPNGDMNFSFYGQAVPYCEVSLLFNSREKNYQKFGIFYEYDFCGRKVKETPVTSLGKVATERTIEYVYDQIGNLERTIHTGLSVLEKTFNTLGNQVLEKQMPTSTKSGEAPATIFYRYNSGGQLVEKQVDNNALAFVKTDGKVIPEQKNVPQITKYIFDSLGRLQKTILPDGLVQERVYDEHSLPSRMTWYAVSAPQKILRDLKIDYTVLGQCSSVTDLKTEKIIRRHAFDLLGNCTESADIDWSGKEIILSREFDSVGAKRSEILKYDNIEFPAQTFDYDLASGWIRKNWLGLHQPSFKFWQSETFQLDSSERLVSVSLDNKSTPFAMWQYMGTLPVRRTVTESRLNTTTSYNEFLEPEALVIRSNTDGQTIGKLQYGYGPQGQAEFTSSKLSSESSVRQYEFAAYSSFDSYRRLVAQNAEQHLPVSLTWQQRAKQVLAQPSDQNLIALQTERRKYDQASNIWVIYHGGFLNSQTASSFTEKQNPLFISPAQPITLYNGTVQEPDLRELASNRDVSTGVFRRDRKSLETKKQLYDKLGCLIEFEGTYWNGVTRRPAKWKLVYDPMGRLIKLSGYAINDSNFDSIKKDDLLADLYFSYDSENRRICKEVVDHCSHKEKTKSFTVYTGNHQSLVFSSKAGEISLLEQYLWNPGSQELLMAAMPENVAQGIQTVDMKRYYFQQDKGYNVIFTSKYENSRCVTVSAMSYLGFGENATRAEITDIRSSDSERYKKYAYDKTLQNLVPACWYSNSKPIHHLELQLAGNDMLSALKIWTADKFPNTFAVFVFAPYQVLPTANSLLELIGKAKENLVAIVEDRNYFDQYKTPDWENPYNLSLLDKKGNRIIIVWEESCNVEVREFEVTKVPNNPGTIAFAGQWLDRETNMYYQINRYRLAESNKFISPDPLGYFDGNNLYAYAHNNPLEWHDPDGQWPHILVGAGIGAFLGGGMYTLNCWLNGASFDWAEFGVSVFAGAVSGASAAALYPVNPIFASFVAGAGGGAMVEGGITYIQTENWEKSLISAGKGALWGGMAGAFAGTFGIFGGSSSNFMSGLLQSTGAGALTGGLFSGARRGFDVYCETGDWATAFYAASQSAVRGTIMGGIAAMAGYSLARLSQACFKDNGGKASSTYERPAGYRKGVRDQVWNNNKEISTGQVRDTITGRFMSKNSPWDMGHKFGYEWWKFQKYAEAHGLSRKQVLDWNNNPEHFRPELPSSNRCHAAENLTSEFYGANDIQSSGFFDDMFGLSFGF